MDSNLTFNEVKLVWNKVIPDIRENIKVCELLHFLHDFFATSSIEKVLAQDREHGKIHATNAFFEEAKHKPSSFPTILAALKQINQPDILITILKVVIKELKPERHEYIFKKLRDAARELSIELSVNVEEEITAALNRPSSQGDCVVSGTGQALDGQPKSASPIRPRAEVPVQNDPNPPVGRAVSPENKVPEIAPHRQSSAVQLQSEVIYQRDQTSISNQGIPLGKLISSARKKISEKLQMQIPPENQPVWEILLDLEDLDISATETSEIEKSRHPGKAFYDQLMNREYTTTELKNMLQRHGCDDAAETVRQQSTKVSQPPPWKQDLAKLDENNLNLAIQRTTQQQKQEYNIPSQQPGISRGYSNGATASWNESEQSVGVEEPPGSYDDNINIPGEIGDSLQNVSTDGNGTQAVAAVGDLKNEKSTLHPEGERAKLVKDRVSQHDGKESNLESFKELGKPEQSKTVPTFNREVSHNFTSLLNQPELFEGESNGRNTTVSHSNEPPSRQQQGSSAASVGDGAQSQKDETNVKLQEHVQGSPGYNGPPDSIIKLHSDTSQPSDENNESK